MDKQMISEFGTYLKDMSTQGYETYIHGFWLSSILWSVIGMLIILSGVAMIFVTRKILKQHPYGSEHGDGKRIMSTIGTALLFIFGIIILGSHIQGVVAPEYTAIKDLILTFKKD